MIVGSNDEKIIEILLIFSSENPLIAAIFDIATPSLRERSRDVAHREKNGGSLTKKVSSK